MIVEEAEMATGDGSKNRSQTGLVCQECGCGSAGRSRSGGTDQRARRMVGRSRTAVVDALTLSEEAPALVPPEHVVTSSAALGRKIHPFAMPAPGRVGRTGSTRCGRRS